VHSPMVGARKNRCQSASGSGAPSALGPFASGPFQAAPGWHREYDVRMHVSSTTNCIPCHVHLNQTRYRYGTTVRPGAR
jgi:hypothetical protein